MGKINKEFERWRKEVFDLSAKKEVDFSGRVLSTSDYEIPLISIPKDNLTRTGEEEYIEKIGFPGEYPFTRGIYKTMYRGRLWTMRQYAGFRTAKETNERFHHLLKAGQTGLSVAFDLPTQMGYDSSHPLAKGEVGKVGVPIDSILDMRELFEGIPLDKVSTSMTINAPAAVVLGYYIVVAEEKGIEPNKLDGTIQNDILKEYMARGTYIFPPEPSLALTIDTIRFCAQHMPKWKSISISGYHLREAGCSAVQEVAFTLADAIEYCERALEQGLEFDSFAPRISFFFCAHNNLFEEVAKFRAARRIWAKLARDRFGAKNPRSMMLRFHTQTAGSMLTAQQPLNNVVRVTIQALAAVLGGTQSLHTNSYDEALNLPTEKSATLALRTQQIIAHESGVADSVDPLAGSYLVEELTDRIESEVLTYLEKIDAMGGMLRAIEKGFPQTEIHRKAYAWQKEVDAGIRKIVGVNCYTEEVEAVPAIPHDEKAEEEQVRRLEYFRTRREEYVPGFSAAKLELALSELSKACEEKKFICERIIDCVRAGATEGEIIKAMEKVWGRFAETKTF